MRKQIAVAAFPLKFQAALSQIARVSNDASCEGALFYFIFPEQLFRLTAAKVM